MEWLIENWYILVGLVAALAAIIVFIIEFCKKPSSEQIKNLKEWLKWAVIQAEKELGGGTGQLKLRMVYDMAVKAFPWVGMILSFEAFSGFVDEALEWMRHQLNANAEILTYVEE